MNERLDDIALAVYTGILGAALVLVIVLLCCGVPA